MRRFDMPTPTATDGVLTYETTVRIPIRVPLPQLLKISVTDSGLREFQEYTAHSSPSERMIILLFSEAILRDDTDHEVAKGKIRVHVQAESVTPATLAMLTRLLGSFRGIFSMAVEGSYSTGSTVITSVSVNAIVSARLQPA